MNILDNYDNIKYITKYKEKGVMMFILKAIFIGSITGFSASIPPGPASIESIKSSIDDGFWSGFKISLGAVLADYVYILLIHFGLSSLLSFNKKVEALFWIISGIILIIFNRFSQKSSNKNLDNQENINKRKIPGLLQGFLLTFLNPSTPSIWIAVSGTVMKVWLKHGDAFYYLCLISMVVATLLWFIFLNLIAANGIKKFKNDNLTNNTSNAIYYILYILAIIFIISGLIKLFM